MIEEHHSGAERTEGTDSTSGTEGGTAPPRDYRLMVPEGWVRIALDPAVWPRRIEALVERRFKGVDNAPHLKAQMREELDKLCADAWSAGGVELYLSFMMVGGIPVSASLLVTLVPRPEGVARPALEDSAVALAAIGENVTVAGLPAGKAMLHRYKSDPQPGSGSAYADTHYDALFDVPRSQSQLLLSFSTPVEPLADPLVELFESITYSLAWRD